MLEVDPSARPVLVALDPGLHTGVAMFRHGGLPEQEHSFTSGEIEGRFEFMATFERMFEIGAPLVVVCESFTITSATAQKSPQPDPYYIIGAVEWLCHKTGTPFRFQSPAQAKQFATDEKLKAVGWYAPGQGHANDAARHALRYAVAAQFDGYDELLLQITGALGLA